MDEWGLNPSTVRAIASVVTAIGVIFAWLSLRERKKRRQAIEREMAVRMRPWMGVFDFDFLPAFKREGRDEDALFLLLKNFGALPAQKAKVRMKAYPRVKEDKEPDNTAEWEEEGEKSILPGEDGNYTIAVSKYPQFESWRSKRRDVKIDGAVSYALDEEEFETEFAAFIMFSECEEKDDDGVKIKWRNQRSI